MELRGLSREKYEGVRKSVEDIILNLLEERKSSDGTVRLSFSEDKGDEFKTFINRVNRKNFYKFSEYMGGAEDAVSSMILLLMYCLVNKRGIEGKDYKYIKNNKVFRRSLMRYITDSSQQLMPLLMNQSLKEMSHGGKTVKVYVREDSIDTVLSFTGENSITYHDVLTESSSVFGGDSVKVDRDDVIKVSKYVKYFEGKKEELLNDRQLATYNLLKDDYITPYSFQGDGGEYQRVGQYLKSRGVSPDYFYTSFKVSLNRRLDQAIKEGEFMKEEKFGKLRNQLKYEVDVLLGRDDLSDETIEYALCEIISRYHRKGLDSEIEDGLDVTEIVDLVRCVKGWRHASFKIDVNGEVELMGKNKDCEDLKMIRSIIYKIVNNINKMKEDKDVYIGKDLEERRETLREIKIEKNKERRRREREGKKVGEEVVKDEGGYFQMDALGVISKK